jgi:ABC-type multidrug transport system ATPase subunit
MLLDEPTTGLDPHLRIEILNFLFRINQKFHTTILLVSHDLECVDYCDKVVVFTDGCIVDFGNPRDMTNSLPNQGRSMIIYLPNLKPDQDEFLDMIKEIKYYLHIGRNKFKFFIESDHQVPKILSQLEAQNITFHAFSFEYSVFLDYFRVNSLYNYAAKAKALKMKLNEPKKVLL